MPPDLKPMVMLRLEGPLQSWGWPALNQYRPTSLWPTKSGVVGLLGCALGWRSDESLAQLGRDIRLGVRADRRGQLLEDFQTVRGGTRTADGRVKGDTVISTRGYLAGASFVAAVACKDEAQTESLARALAHPRWPYFLGRRACVPSLPVLEGLAAYPDLETALRAWPGPPSGKEREAREITAMVECEATADGAEAVQDVSLSRSRRLFGVRYVRRVTWPVPEPKAGEADG